MSLAKEGIAKTEKHKTLINKAKKGKPLTEAHKAFINNANKGKNYPLFGRSNTPRIKSKNKFSK
jgi:hypothetical protein